MSKLRSFQRHLNPSKVCLAKQVAEEKIKIARQVVLDHAKKDAQFAADVLKAVGENLPKEIKEACEESVKQKEIKDLQMDETKRLVAKWEKTGLLDKLSDTCNTSSMAVLIESESKQLVVGAVKEEPTCCGGACGCGDLTHTMVPMQTDGGGEILVHETELPDYPRDGEKLVQEEGPKAEKA